MSEPAPTLITPAGLKTSLWRLSAHLNFGRAGSVICRECMTFPGLSYSDSFDRRTRRTTRTFFVAGDQAEFDTLQAAAKAWNDQRRARAAAIAEEQAA